MQAPLPSVYNRIKSFHVFPERRESANRGASFLLAIQRVQRRRCDDLPLQIDSDSPSQHRNRNQKPEPSLGPQDDSCITFERSLRDAHRVARGDIDIRNQPGACFLEMSNLHQFLGEKALIPHFENLND